MINPTKELYKRIKAKYIPISVICKETGLSPKAIYSSLTENAKRQLRADELLAVCDFLKIDPMELLEKKKFHWTIKKLK